MIKSILFDLDGTLFDTGLDFQHIFDQMLQKRGLPRLDYDEFRKIISAGSAAMTSHAFQLNEDDEKFMAILDEFRLQYMEHMGTKAVFFPGVAELLKEIDSQNIPWGIVTNRLENYIVPFLIKYALHERPRCFVGADTTEHRKPHPAPLLHAAELMKTKPEECIYVGDYKTDIEAANAANIISVAVTWGYTDSIASLEAVNPDYIIDNPEAILELVMTK